MTIVNSNIMLLNLPTQRNAFREPRLHLGHPKVGCPVVDHSTMLIFLNPNLVTRRPLGNSRPARIINQVPDDILNDSLLNTAIAQVGQFPNINLEV